MQHEQIFGDVVSVRLAQQAEADGQLVRYAPSTAREAGFTVPVLLTQRAFAEAVEWDRPGDEWMQDEDARFFDVLTMARLAAKVAGHGGAQPIFQVARIPNRTKSGVHSKSETATLLKLALKLEIYSEHGKPCLIISLPQED